MIKAGSKAVFHPMKRGKQDVNNPQYGKVVYIIRAVRNGNAIRYGFRVVDEKPVYMNGGEVLQWASLKELIPIINGNL